MTVPDTVSDRISERNFMRPVNSTKFTGRSQAETSDQIESTESTGGISGGSSGGSSSRMLRRGFLRGVHLSVFLLLSLPLLSIFGCTQTGGPSQSASWGRTSTWTPVDHARSQLDWIRTSSGNMSEEELFHAMNTPWNGSRLTPAQRQEWIRNQLVEDSKETGFSEVSGNRVLGRPGAMDSARQRWQKEQEENRRN